MKVTDSPPERTNYQALWHEAIAPVHPIIDARVRLRTVEQSIEDRYGCRQRPITGELDALDASTKAALAAETLKLAYIREMKSRRFKNALKSVVVFYAWVLVTFLLLRNCSAG